MAASNRHAWHRCLVGNSTGRDFFQRCDERMQLWRLEGCSPGVQRSKSKKIGSGCHQLQFSNQCMWKEPKMATGLEFIGRSFANQSLVHNSSRHYGSFFRSVCHHSPGSINYLSWTNYVNQINTTSSSKVLLVLPSLTTLASVPVALVEPGFGHCGFFGRWRCKEPGPWGRSYRWFYYSDAVMSVV